MVQYEQISLTSQGTITLILCVYFAFVALVGGMGTYTLKTDCKNEKLRQNLRYSLVLGLAGITFFISYFLCASSCRREEEKGKPDDVAYEKVQFNEINWYILWFILALLMGSFIVQWNIFMELKKDDPDQLPCQKNTYVKLFSTITFGLSIGMLVLWVILFIFKWKKYSEISEELKEGRKKRKELQLELEARKVELEQQKRDIDKKQRDIRDKKIHIKEQEKQNKILARNASAGVFSQETSKKLADDKAKLEKEAGELDKFISKYKEAVDTFRTYEKENKKNQVSLKQEEENKIKEEEEKGKADEEQFKKDKQAEALAKMQKAKDYANNLRNQATVKGQKSLNKFLGEPPTIGTPPPELVKSDYNLASTPFNSSGTSVPMTEEDEKRIIKNHLATDRSVKPKERKILTKYLNSSNPIKQEEQETVKKYLDNLENSEEFSEPDSPMSDEEREKRTKALTDD
jgi:hypothetical protein